MEKIERYRAVICDLLKEYQDFLVEHTRTDVDTDVICDDLNGQYMVMRVGWRGERRVHRPLFYLRLKNGKIWVEEDWTKEGIAHELVLAGVPHEDIVLAFNPPLVRHLTEFAVA